MCVFSSLLSCRASVHLSCVVTAGVSQAKQAALPPPPPLTAEALAGGHDGEWRTDSTADAATYNYVMCATTVANMGLSKRMCTHKGLNSMLGEHWSCCGKTEVTDLCTGPGALLRIPVVPYATLPSSVPTMPGVNPSGQDKSSSKVVVV